VDGCGRLRWQPDGRHMMDYLPLVIAAEHRGGYRIHVWFNDGSEKTIDSADWLDGRHRTAPGWRPRTDSGHTLVVVRSAASLRLIVGGLRPWTACRWDR
jgi:hypothetical protein